MSGRIKELAGTLTAAGAAALVVLFSPVGAHAQAPEAGAWLPWVGCWESASTMPAGVGEEDPLLCVLPLGDGRVEMTTWVDGVVGEREVLASDGSRQDVVREGCSGWQSARFSTDRRRIFLESEFACEGDVERTSTGLIAMVSPAEWIDVQVVDVGGREMAWVERYREASPERLRDAGLEDVVDERAMALRTARFRAAAPADVDAVIETSREVHPEAAKAWLAEQNDPLDLDADALVRMADAGVAPEVIDVAVAVSYPDRFALADGQAMPREAERQAADRYRDPYYHDGYYGSRGFWGLRRGYGYGSFYRPWGFGGWGYYGGYSPRIIVVQPVTDGEAGGRMVRGRGYVPGSGSSRGSARPRGSSGPPSTGAATRRGSSAGSSVGRSGGSGSGSTSTGRKAKRRSGGGGGSGGDDGGGELQLLW